MYGSRCDKVAADADVVLCIDRLRMTILGATALFPGLCTLMSNLWQSSTDLLALEEEAAQRATVRGVGGGDRERGKRELH